MKIYSIPGMTTWFSKLRDANAEKAREPHGSGSDGSGQGGAAYESSQDSSGGNETESKPQSRPNPYAKAHEPAQITEEDLIQAIQIFTQDGFNRAHNVQATLDKTGKSLNVILSTQDGQHLRTVDAQEFIRLKESWGPVATPGRILDFKAR